MAVLVFNNAKVTINAVNLSDHILQVTLRSTGDVVDTSAMGATAKSRAAGLLDNSVTLEFQQDFATSSVEATLYPLIGTVVTAIVQPVNAAVGATNPTYTFSILISEWAPIDGSLGELLTASVSWPISGAIAKAVA